MTNDSRGSLWRKWDLHVHTPASGLNNSFGDDWDKYVRTLFNRAVERQVAAIGVTDYFSMDGYRTLKAYMSDVERLRALFASELKEDPTHLDKVARILLLPNIELRLDTFVSGKQNDARSINFHAIFSDELDVAVIEDNFLFELKCLVDAAAQGHDERITLTRENMRRLGERLKAEHAAFRGDDAFRVACKNVTVSHEQVTDVLKAHPATFENKYILVLAEDEVSDLSYDGRGHLTRKTLYKKMDMMFSPSAKTREVLLSSDFAEEFGRAKPCIWGSDAHDFDRLLTPTNDHYCWIKADATFTGLLQVKNEPRDRCYIGPQPETIAALRQHARPWIKSLVIEKQSPHFEEVWFGGVRLDFNPELVAIIGKKGSGKSALADILALLGGARVSETDFAFLNRERFRRPDPSNRADRSAHFSATVEWSNRESVARRLSETVRDTELERVRYLPQGYLEKICNHRTTEAYRQFEAELDRVIFSHVPAGERLGKTCLADLIDDQTAEVRRSISRLKADVRALNVQIIAVEHRLSEMARRALADQITSVEKQLAALHAEPIDVVPEPTKDAATIQATTERLARIAELEKERVAVALQLTEKDATQRKTQLQISAAVKLRERLREIETFAQSSTEAVAELAAAVGLSADELFVYRIQHAPVTSVIARLQMELAAIQPLLDAKNEQSLIRIERGLAERINAARSGLDEPNRRYQKYLADLAAREARMKEIVGDASTAGTLEFYREQLRATTETLPRELAELQQNRAEKTLQIHSHTVAIANVFRRFYERIQQFIDERDIWKGSIELEFDVAIRPDGFVERFFSMVAQNVIGSFCGVEEGAQRVTELLERQNFSDGRSTLAFVDTILDQMNHDYRYTQPSPTSLDRQLRKGVERKQLLDFLYSIDFIVPKYELKLGGRTLQELSPGERGLLLLIFYLVIDEERSPLILDQPEENLDNQSIKDALVPCIQYAKRRRQMFIVTHNPNLAVVCDAEQIVVSDIDRASHNTITYVAGGIESLALNRQVVDVLEGTPPAFENRRRKYRTAGSLPTRAASVASLGSRPAGLRRRKNTRPAVADPPEPDSQA